MTKETNNNRNTLISMMALSEDIARTNTRIYELLRELMNNPEEITNIKTSINNLYDKINNLKNYDIGIPLIEEEHVLIPGPLDVSPKEDPEYKKYEQVLSNPEIKLEEPTPEPEPTPAPIAEPPRKTRKTKEPLKTREARELESRKTTDKVDTRRPNKRPNKPLGNKKRTSQPNEDNQQK